jgi:hypothetical protein
MKRSIFQALRRRPKPLVQNTNELTGKMNKTKDDLKDGTSLKHLDKRLSVIAGSGFLEEKEHPQAERARMEITRPFSGLLSF